MFPFQLRKNEEINAGQNVDQNARKIILYLTCILLYSYPVNLLISIGEKNLDVALWVRIGRSTHGKEREESDWNEGLNKTERAIWIKGLNTGGSTQDNRERVIYTRVLVVGWNKTKSRGPLGTRLAVGQEKTKLQEGLFDKRLAVDQKETELKEGR